MCNIYQCNDDGIEEVIDDKSVGFGSVEYFAQNYEEDNSSVYLEPIDESEEINFDDDDSCYFPKMKWPGDGIGCSIPDLNQLVDKVEAFEKFNEVLKERERQCMMMVSEIEGKSCFCSLSSASSEAIKVELSKIVKERRELEESIKEMQCIDEKGDNLDMLDYDVVTTINSVKKQITNIKMGTLYRDKYTSKIPILMSKSHQNSNLPTSTKSSKSCKLHSR